MCTNVKSILRWTNGCIVLSFPKGAKQDSMETELRNYALAERKDQQQLSHMTKPRPEMNPYDFREVIPQILYCCFLQFEEQFL